MLRKSFWIAALGLGMSVIPATSASAQQYLDQGTWELTLSGSGASNRDVNAGNFGIQGSIGYFVLDQLEVVGRQTISYVDNDNFPGGSTSIAFSSALALDYHFDLDRWQPFVGAQFGYIYGDDVHDTFIAGPEAGVKYFVNATTFVFASVEYQFLFDEGDDADDAVDDGLFVYGLGIGFKW